MKRLAQCALMLGAVAVLTVTAQAAQVTNVKLTYERGFTVARIDVDGPIRYTHQTEVPKDGKPHRVIVDVLGADHALSSRVFSDLPDCPVRSIRSSQYAVTPEKITRVVFDINSAPIYTINANERTITVSFTDKSVRPFDMWSSASYTEEPAPATGKSGPAKVQKSPEAINSEIEKDHLASLTEPKPSPKAAPAHRPAMAGPKPDKTEPTLAQKPTEQQSATKSKSSVTTSEKSKQDKPVATATTAGKATQSMIAREPAPEKPSAKTPVAVEGAVVLGPPMPATPTLVEKPARENSKPEGQQALAGKQSPAKQAGKQKPDMTEAAKPTAQKPASKPAKTPTHASKKPVAKPAATLAEKPDDDDAAGSSRRTSRFRRTTKQMAKIKGTMVAEFPRRLVIKYKKQIPRDPFETLINTVKTYDSPFQPRMPNVEGIQLVGILESETGSNRALFQDREGYSYILQSGDKVQKGYVLRVENDKVYFQIFEYGWSRTVALKLESFN